MYSGQGHAAGEQDSRAVLLWETPRVPAQGFLLTCQRKFHVLPSRRGKAGFYAAEAKGGYNGVSNTQVRVQQKTAVLSVFLDSMLGE